MIMVVTYILLLFVNSGRLWQKPHIGWWFHTFVEHCKCVGLASKFPKFWSDRASVVGWSSVGTVAIWRWVGGACHEVCEHWGGTMELLLFTSAVSHLTGVADSSITCGSIIKNIQSCNSHNETFLLNNRSNSSTIWSLSYNFTNLHIALCQYWSLHFFKHITVILGSTKPRTQPWCSSKMVSLHVESPKIVQSLHKKQ